MFTTSRYRTTTTPRSLAFERPAKAEVNPAGPGKIGVDFLSSARRVARREKQRSRRRHGRHRSWIYPHARHPRPYPRRQKHDLGLGPPGKVSGTGQTLAES